MNSLYQEMHLSQSTSKQFTTEQENQIRQAADAFKQSPNKKQFLQNIIASNPAIKNMKSITNLLNGNIDENMMRSLFIKQAESQGIDPNYMMNLLGLN